MTRFQLQKLETELAKRGYKKYTQNLVSGESWAWFKTFDKKCGEDGERIAGYQIGFRVWDHSKYVPLTDVHYGFDFWTSSILPNHRMDFTSNWEPICDFETFEAMARDFNQLTQKYIKL